MFNNNNTMERADVIMTELRTMTLYANTPHKITSTVIMKVMWLPQWVNTVWETCDWSHQQANTQVAILWQCWWITQFCQWYSPHKLSLFQWAPIPCCLVFQLLFSPTHISKYIMRKGIFLIAVEKGIWTELHLVVWLCLHPVNESLLIMREYLCSGDGSDDVGLGQRETVAAF